MYARYIPPAKNKNPPQNSTVREPSPEPPVTVSAPVSSATPYARYIPPPKGGQKPRQSASAAVPQKIVFTEDDFPNLDKKKRKRAEEEVGESEPRAKKKSSKKLKPVVDGTEDNVEDSNPANDAEEFDSIKEDEKSSKKSKGKKEKKSKKRSRDDQDDLEGDNEDKAADGELTTSRSEKEEKGKKENKEKKEKKETKEKKEKRDKKEKKRKLKEEVGEDVLTDESPSDRHKKHKAILERKDKSLSRPAAKDSSSRVDGLPPTTSPDAEDEGVKEPEEVHGLEPLPQPEPSQPDQGRPTYETLPSWLAAPIRVSTNTRASFPDLGINPEASKVLASKGYNEAFAVQTAAIPLLLPSPDRQGDIVISAATGSGKTLAYVLPMVRDLSQGVVTRLRGLIVVPTRELVKQAQEACEACATAFAGGGRKRLRVGISMGSQSLRQEQNALMAEEQVYDPEGYSRLKLSDKVLDVDDSDNEENNQNFTPALNASTPLPDHVVWPVSSVDILICTPGRLVEHINQTPCFSLDYVRWLVVDEADKLLSQSFQQWLDTVMGKLATEKPGARDFAGSNKSGVRKVVLSATMTRDLSLLSSLKLRRPKLIVLEGPRPDEQSQTSLGVEGEHVLPDLLKESVIKVRNPGLKPLYLVDLLNSSHMVPMNADVNGARTSSPGLATHARPASETSDSESDSDDSTSSSSSSSSSSSLSSSPSLPSSPRASPPSNPPPLYRTTVLIFTKSNEAALRLSRLLVLLSPHLAPLVGTLASTARTAHRRRTLRAFAAGRLRVLVASDLVARGIDLPGLDHVVNYDVPAGPAPYVHRVGRTARAGRAGHAWTLVTNPEAGWFWREIGGEGKGGQGKGIRRAAKVERVRVGGDEDGGRFSEERVSEYEEALGRLGREAGEMRKGGREMK